MKSKVELERDGQYRSDRHRARSDEEVSIAVLGQPELLTGTHDDLAKFAFQALVNALPAGAVGAADSMGLTILAATWSRWLHLTQCLEEWANTPETDEYNRIFRQVMDCEKQIRQFSGEFGLTPKSRSQIKLQLSQASKEKTVTEMIDDIRHDLDED